MIFGTGFPPFRGGLCRWADQLPKQERSTAVEQLPKAFGDRFQGGFFTDASADFLTSIQNATFTYYVLGNGAGTAATYNGQGYYLLDTTFWSAFEEVLVSTVSVASANFADGTVTNGRVMQLTIVPEPGAALLALVGVAIAAALRRK